MVCEGGSRPTFAENLSRPSNPVPTGRTTDRPSTSPKTVLEKGREGSLILRPQTDLRDLQTLTPPVSVLRVVGSVGASRPVKRMGEVGA